METNIKVILNTINVKDKEKSLGLMEAYLLGLFIIIYLMDMEKKNLKMVMFMKVIL